MDLCKLNVLLTFVSYFRADMGDRNWLVYLHINKLKQHIPWIRGRKHTKESIEKIRAASKRPCSEETKRKIGESNSGNKNGMFGKSPSGEIIQATILRFSKPVLQLDKDDNVIGEFSSASEAERYLGVKGNHVSCCCTGKRKAAYGYKWKYKV